MSNYRFRPLTEADRPLLLLWRSRPHVSEWWDEAEAEDEWEELSDSRIRRWIVELDGEPIAYLQDYDIHGWPDHHLSFLPVGSRGIDQYIGLADMLGQGHGSAFIRQYVDGLISCGVPAVGTDPHPHNRRARKAYERAGFRSAGASIDTPWGLALPMARWSFPR